MSPPRRPEGRRPSDAFETVAWKAPTATRFRDQVANDAPTRGRRIRDLPAWVIVVGGGVIAALLGALLGAALGY